MSSEKPLTLESLASTLKDVVEHMQKQFQKQEDQLTRILNDMPKTSKGNDVIQDGKF